MATRNLTKDQIAQLAWVFFSMGVKSGGVWVYPNKMFPGGRLILKHSDIPEEMKKLKVPPAYRKASRHERRHGTAKR